MGLFGPFVFPGNLARAIQQAWGWPEAAHIITRHTAFLRIRLTYAQDEPLHDSVKLLGASPVDELSFVTRLALRLCDLPQTLCYFNPNAEILCPPEMLIHAWKHYEATGQVPLDIWSNRRLFTLSDEPGWALMDTIGMQQLDLGDHEACFKSNSYNPNDIALFLLNLSAYTAQSQQTIRNGDTLDGPGNCLWRARFFEKSSTVPPRPILRWSPLDGTPIPSAFLAEKKP